MPLKISGALKRIPLLFRNAKPEEERLHLSMHKSNVIKLASLRLMPNLKLLSFRVSRNFLYFSFARPNTDLVEFTELFTDNDAVCE